MGYKMKPMWEKDQRKGSNIAGLLFVVAGLIWTITGNVPIGMMNVAVGMMFLVLGARKVRSTPTVEKCESNEPTDKSEGRT